VRLGTALQHVGLVADFQLLLLCSLALVALAFLQSAPCSNNNNNNT
jgi:hypothetical protein